MRKFLLFLSVLFFCLCGYAQVKIYDVNLSAVVDKKYEGFEKGSTIRVSRIVCETVRDTLSVLNRGYKTFRYVQVDDRLVPYTNKLGESLSFEYKTIQDIWNAQFVSEIFPVLFEKGAQKKLRYDMEQDVLEYVDKFNLESRLYQDPYLESYIYSLVSKIVPDSLLDGRQLNIKLMILNDNSLSMGMFANGLLMTTTGFLSCLHSEDELVAALSHEIAHLILNHQMQNVNKEVTRKNRAEFWAAVLTGVTAVAEGVAAANSDYVPGLATAGMAMVSSAVASQVIDRLGMKYNHDQERAADNISRQILSVLQYNTNALATVLSNIKAEMDSRGSYEPYFESYTHPALVERIGLLGEPQFIEDPAFEKKISFVITRVAQARYDMGHFRETIDLVNQNIENEVAVSDDYLLKAHCLLAIQDNEQSNREVLDLIYRAKELKPSDINIYKTEILAYLRLNDRATALRLLQEYDALLGNPSAWGDLSWVGAELDWSRNMQIKLKGGM